MGGGDVRVVFLAWCFMNRVSVWFDKADPLSAGTVLSAQ